MARMESQMLQEMQYMPVSQSGPCTISASLCDAGVALVMRMPYPAYMHAEVFLLIFLVETCPSSTGFPIVLSHLSIPIKPAS